MKNLGVSKAELHWSYIDRRSNQLSFGVVHPFIYSNLAPNDRPPCLHPPPGPGCPTWSWSTVTEAA